VNEAAFIDASIQRQLALVDLFRALGGGWSSKG
jgi:multidrug efflux system outer membrane protein